MGDQYPMGPHEVPEQHNDQYSQYAQSASGQYPPQGAPYRQPAYAPPYPQGVYAPVPVQRWNVMCIIGFILSFIIPIAGLIVSIISLVQINRTGEKSRGMSIAGIVIGAVFTVLAVIAAIFAVWVTGWALDHADRYIDSTTCVNGRCRVCDDGYCFTFDEDTTGNDSVSLPGQLRGYVASTMSDVDPSEETVAVDEIVVMATA